MGYIGSEPNQGAVLSQKITSANGSTATFTLNQHVPDADSIIVTIGNVIQEPVTAYSATGTSITFTENVPNGDTIVIRYLGRSIDVPTSYIQADRFKFVATNGQDTFTGGDANSLTLAYSTGNIDVFLNGVRLDESDFTASNGTSIVLGSGAATSDELIIVAYRTVQISNALDKTAGGTVTSAVTVKGDVTITSTDAGATDDPSLILYRNSSSPADSDDLGEILFRGRNWDGSATVHDVDYAKIWGEAQDVSDGNEDGKLHFDVMKAGTLTNLLNFNAVSNTTFSTNDVKFNTGVDIIFEGATANANETTLTVADPSQDNTITLPDATGTVLVGLTTLDTIGGIASKAQIEGTDYASGSLSVWRNANDDAGAYLLLGKSRGTSVGSDTIIQDGDDVGIINFVGADGGDRAHPVASIRGAVDGTPGSNDMPGRLEFWTTADGGTTMAEKMRIDDAGNVGIGTTSPAQPLHVKGGTNNGSIRVEHASAGHYNDVLYDGMQASWNQFLLNGGNLYTYSGNTLTGELDETIAKFIGATTTTSNSANCQVDGNGRIHTHSSSGVYKTAVEDLTDEYADKIFQLEPKFYKANTDKVGDDMAKFKPDWTFYGLLAEDVAKVEPRLVQYKVSKMKDRESIKDEIVMEELETPEPMTVNYSTLTVHLINIVKRFKTRIETLEASNADLIKRVEALEKA